MVTGIDKALSLLKTLPRVTIGNLKPLPKTHKKKRARRGRQRGRQMGRGSGGQTSRGTLPVIGFEGGQTPFYIRIPKEPYYYGHHVRRQYPPLSLLQLQRLIDLGRVNTEEPIDLTTLCNTKVINVDYSQRHYGINLTDEGADIFAAKVNIEVQWTNEVTIAAIERNGGIITTRFFDLDCVRAMANAALFFGLGVPIPRCKLPPQDAVAYYSDPKNRGYLADPDQIQQCRVELAQKFGYALPNISQDPLYSMLIRRKDPRQIWFDLEPGWIVNLRDKTVLKPTDEQLLEYYKS